MIHPTQDGEGAGVGGIGAVVDVVGGLSFPRLRIALSCGA
jgi:hypothetical protein